MTDVLIVETHADDYARALAAEFPNLRIHTARMVADFTGDGAAIDVLVAFGIAVNDPFLAQLTQLKWVQSLATGVDHFLRSKTMRPGVLITSARGIHGPAMRETVMHLILSVSHGSNRIVANNTRHVWERRAWPLLAGKTAVVVGTGVSGAAIGKMLQGFGLRVVGISRTPRSVDGFDEIRPSAELTDVVASADYLVNVLPGSDENRNMIGRAVFARMKPTAYFINVGRGETVDEAALLECLGAGRIAGAGLDVFEREPLPAESPLWDMPNVFLTPHIGGFFIEYTQMALPILTHNMRCYLADRVGDMQNVINTAPKTS